MWYLTTESRLISRVQPPRPEAPSGHGKAHCTWGCGASPEWPKHSVGAAERLNASRPQVPSSTSSGQLPADFSEYAEFWPSPTAGIIRQNTVLLDPDKLGLEACFFVLIRTSEHQKEWQDRFLETLKGRLEVVEAHRLAGDVDYILKVRVRNARAYDDFYQALNSQVKIFNITSLLSMEEIKTTTELPL